MVGAPDGRILPRLPPLSFGTAADGYRIQMRYLTMVTDYDGTLATNGQVPDRVVHALERLRESGRRALLVTGRELDDLRRVFDRLELFDRVVAENGALIYEPATREERPLGEAPPQAFVEELVRRGVAPLSVGRVIVATWEPHETVVLQTIRDLGLELHVVFNKGAVMVLPSSLNKATGLGAALHDLRLSSHNAVGIGDAENDHAFLDSCELSVAVENAVPAVKELCDHVTDGSRGEGVVELIEGLLETDLSDLDERVRRHDVQIGTREGEKAVTIRPYRTNVLVTGPSGSGKSTLVTAFLEGLQEHGYQFCLLDPEGDYEGLDGASVLGTADNPPTVDEAITILDEPTGNVVLNLLGVRLDDRPGFLEALLPRIQELRARTGRPHWIIADEAHHLLPQGLQTAERTMPKNVTSLLMVTVHADAMSPEGLEPVTVLLTPGAGAAESIPLFAEARGTEPPPLPDVPGGKDHAVAWFLPDPPFVFESLQPTGERRRHVRKYAAGDLKDKAFVFRGPNDQLKLRAQNLTLFAQIAEGVDDETWTWHLERGDYVRWFREAVKDDELAQAAEDAQGERDSETSRRHVLRAIEERYTLPAEASP
jgi:hydroxymethylpyrimidine pyrophosphatase-like HAD family hydrolase/energy-coupling factor transporter ATP-binding protein EcfA2